LQDLKEAVISSTEYHGVPSLPDFPSNGSLDCRHGLALGEGRPDVFGVTGESRGKTWEEVVPEFTCTVASNN
jgi:hypothetical protein